MTKSEEKRINMGYIMQIHEKMQVIIKMRRISNCIQVCMFWKVHIHSYFYKLERNGLKWFFLCGMILLVNYAHFGLTKHLKISIDVTFM